MKKLIDVFNGKPCGFSPRMTDEQVRYGQHAINHADALAEALDAVLPHCGSLTREQRTAWAAGIDALASYRGEA